MTKRKNVFTIMFSIFFIVCCLFSLAACGTKSEDETENRGSEEDIENLEADERFEKIGDVYYITASQPVSTSSGEVSYEIYTIVSDGTWILYTSETALGQQMYLKQVNSNKIYDYQEDDDVYEFSEAATVYTNLSFNPVDWAGWMFIYTAPISYTSKQNKTFLDRQVVEYTHLFEGTSETVVIDNATGACLKKKFSSAEGRTTLYECKKFIVGTNIEITNKIKTETAKIVA